MRTKRHLQFYIPWVGWYYGVSDAVLMGYQAAISSVQFVKNTTGLTEHVVVERDACFR